MMNYEGICKLVITDTETGSQRTVEETNHIQDIVLKDGIGVPTTLWVSAFNPGAQSKKWGVNSIPFKRNTIAIDGIPELEMKYYETPTMHVAQYIGRLNVPAEDTEINTAGLGNSTVVWFNEPCVQKTSEIIDIYYRIQLIFDHTWKTPAVLDDFNTKNMNYQDGQNLLLSVLMNGGLYMDANYISGLPKINLRAVDYPIMAALLYVNKTTTREPVTYSIKGDWTVDYTETRNAGRAVSWVGFPYSKIMQDVSPVQSVFEQKKGGPTPFYSPDYAKAGLGTVDINADNWTDPDLGKYLEISIETSGAVGVGSYKLRMHPYVGFNGDGFAPTLMPISSTTANNDHFTEGFKLSRDTYSVENNFEVDIDTSRAMTMPLRYKGGYKMLFCWIDSFALVDITTGRGTAYDNTKIFNGEGAPKFTATSIKQYFVMQNGKLLVSCGASGLYIFEDDLTDVTKIDASTPGLSGVDGCYGACEGYAGRIWAYFHSTTSPGIYYSDDAGANWVQSAFSDSVSDNPDRISGLQASISNPDGHLALIFATGEVDPSNLARTQWTNRWYDNSTQAVTANAYVIGENTLDNNAGTIDDLRWIEGLESRPYKHNYFCAQFVSCAPNDDVWINGFESIRVLTFGASTQVDKVWGGNQSQLCWMRNKDNTQDMLYMYANGYVIAYTPATDYVEQLSNSLGTFDNNTPVYVEDGVFIQPYVNRERVSSQLTEADNRNYFRLIPGSPRALPQRFDRVTYPETLNVCFPEYGWDGAQWVRGHAGEKTLHADAQELFDGITVAFDSSGGDFDSQDQYQTMIFDGVVCDNVTSFEYSAKLYVKPTKEETALMSSTLPVSQSVPNTFITADVSDGLQDSNQYSLSINHLTATGTGLADDYSASARSLNPVLDGTAVSFLPGNCVLPNSSTEVKNAQSWFEFSPSVFNSAHIQMYVGVSDSTVLGQPADENTIQYGFHIDSYQGGSGEVNKAKVDVIESGVVRATVYDLKYDNTLSISSGFRIVLTNNGTILYQYKLDWDDSTWITLYQTPVGAVTVQDYYMDVVAVPYSGRGIMEMTKTSLDTAGSDYYIILGDGIDKGVFSPGFVSVDAEEFTMTIGGAEAVQGPIDNKVDTLVSGVYSVHQKEGVVRFSPDDAGKTVTAQYITVVDD